MNIWRLVAYHDKSLGESVINEMKKSDRIAIGWSGIGDLNKLINVTQEKITNCIKETYPEATNSGLGGPSLIRFYSEMKIGDLVVITNNSEKISVFEIIGPYFYSSDEDSIFGYNHQRNAVQVDSIYEKEILEQLSNTNFANGENQRWTLFKYQLDIDVEKKLYDEGNRYSIKSSAIERSNKARNKCLEYYGYSCQVCNFNFLDTFGDIGKDFIHVHHIEDLSLKKEAYQVDPIKDLIPICPNCHAMAHKRRPSIPIEELKSIRNNYPKSE